MREALRLAALLLALACAPALAAPGPNALELRLLELDSQSYNDPTRALRALREMRARHAGDAALQRRIDFSIGRAEALSGSRDAAATIAQALDKDQAPELAELLRAEIEDRRGSAARAGEHAQRALAQLNPACQRPTPPALVQQGCDWRASWHALRLIQRSQLASGELAFAEASARQALELARLSLPARQQSQALMSMSVVAARQNQGEQAHDWLAQAQPLAGGDPLLMARLRMFEATLVPRTDGGVRQLRLLDEALELAQQAEAPRDAAQIRSNQVDAYMHLGRPREAIEQARLALPVLQSYGDQRLERTLRHNLSVALVLLRQFDAARREIALVEQLREGSGNLSQRAVQLRELGEAYARAGQHKEALRLYHEERGVNEELNARTRQAALRQLAHKYDSGARERDLELLRRDEALKDQQLNNRQLARSVGIGLAVLLGLSLLLVVVMLGRVREANRRLKAKQALLRAQSERDPLTDLANRRHFLGVMEQRMQGRFDGALMMVDIDHFKHINDRQGHAAGDAVICEVARRLRTAVRDEDLVVRWGGEEFLIFITGVGNDALAQLAQRVLQAIGGTPVATEAGPLRVTASIGFAHFPLPPAQIALHWEQAVNWADMALYTAKSRGRNRAVGIGLVAAEDAQALLQIEADFENACSNERVQLLTVQGPEPAAA